MVASLQRTLLLRKAARRVLCSNTGFTPAYAASIDGPEACLVVLRDAGCDLGQASNDGVTPALIASHNGHEACLVVLRDAGCDLGQANNNGATPAFMASQNGHRDCVGLLKDAGAYSLKDGFNSPQSFLVSVKILTFKGGAYSLFFYSMVMLLAILSHSMIIH